jgi:hypothetical protein
MVNRFEVFNTCGLFNLFVMGSYAVFAIASIANEVHNENFVANGFVTTNATK